MPYSSLAPSFLSYFNFILVLVLKFPGSLNLLFHNLSSHQFSWKNTSLAQFIPRIYNKIIIKILGYFWGVTVCIWVYICIVSYIKQLMVSMGVLGFNLNRPFILGLPLVFSAADGAVGCSNNQSPNLQEFICVVL